MKEIKVEPVEQIEQTEAEVSVDAGPDSPRKRKPRADGIKVIESPAIGCSRRTYQLVTATAEIRGVTRSEMLDLIVEQFFKRFI